MVSEAHVEWLADPGSGSQETRLVASKLVPTGSFRLDNPRIVKSGTAWRVDLQAIETHTSPLVRGVWTVRLAGPGELWATFVQR